MNILFVIDSGVIGTDYIKNVWKDEDIQVIYLTNIHNQEGDTLRNLTEDYFIHCNTENYDDVEGIINNFIDENIIGIITFVDSRLELCSKLCKKFNVKDIPYELIADLLSKSEKGLILKPAYADGARGISFLNTNEDINQIYELVDKSLPLSVHPDDIIVQEFIDGELISVEGYVVNEKVTFIGVTGRQKVNKIESVFIFPYEKRVQEEKINEAKDAIRSLVSRSNYRNGFFHTEFILSSEKIKLIDCNFGRPCGANILEVIDCSYEIKPEKMYKQVMEIQINNREILKEDFCKNTKTIDSLGIAYGIKKSGMVLQVNFDKNAKTKHGLVQNMGCFVLKMGEVIGLGWD